jgi:hypothetical protein
MKIKSLFLALLLIGSSALASCTLETTTATVPTLCRRYYLKPYVSLVDTGDTSYGTGDLTLPTNEVPNDNLYNINAIYKNNMANEEFTHIDFRYNGKYQFLLSNPDGEQVFYEEGTYVVSGKTTDSQAITLKSSNGDTRECKAAFINKNNDDIIITYLRVAYKIEINSVETDCYLWFFNGIFGTCPFSE